MNTQDRDKVRVLALLRTRRGEAFNIQEISKLTGMDERRVKTAGDSLSVGGLIKIEEDYLWVEKYATA